MRLPTSEQRREPPSFCEQSGDANSWLSLAPEWRPATECGEKALEPKQLQRHHHRRHHHHHQQQHEHEHEHVHESMSMSMGMSMGMGMSMTMTMSMTMAMAHVFFSHLCADESRLSTAGRAFRSPWPNPWHPNSALLRWQSLARW